MIQTQCPGCKTRFDVSERLLGRMATCSACGTVFTVAHVRGGSSAGEVIDVHAEVISSDSPEDEATRPGAAEESASDVERDTDLFSPRSRRPQRSHGWGGFDPSRHQGNATRVRTFYFEKRFGEGPNCCSFGCFGISLIAGFLLYFFFSALFG